VSNNKSLQRLVVLILITASLVACNVLPGAPTSTLPTTAPTSGSSTTISPTAVPTAAPPTTGSAVPKPGQWVGSAEFGEFEFFVNPQSTGIPKLVFPGVEVKTDDEAGYPIKDGQFKIYLSWIRLTGTFDQSGMSASGTWEYVKQAGSGTWTATPAE